MDYSSVFPVINLARFRLGRLRYVQNRRNLIKKLLPPEFWKYLGALASMFGVLCFIRSYVFMLAREDQDLLLLIPVFLLGFSMVPIAWFAEKIPLPKAHWKKGILVLTVFITTNLYSNRLDNVLNGRKPDAWIIMTNGLFALAMLSISMKLQRRFETGFFMFSLGLMFVLLTKNNWILCFPGAVISYFLMYIHDLSVSKDDVGQKKKKDSKGDNGPTNSDNDPANNQQEETPSSSSSHAKPSGQEDNVSSGNNMITIQNGLAHTYHESDDPIPGTQPMELRRRRKGTGIQIDAFDEEPETSGESDSDLSSQTALQDLKQLIQNALNKHEFSVPPNQPSPPQVEKPAPALLHKDDEKRTEPVQEKPAELSVPAETADPTKTEDQSSKREEQQADKKETASEEVIESTVVVEAVEEKAAAPAMDDDGAKTVEAIEETVLAVSSVVPAEEPQAAKESEAAAVPPPAEAEAKETKDETPAPPPPEEVSIWGIPLLADERSNVILSKFLQATDFKVKDAFAMIKNIIPWRKEFGIDKLMEENLSDDFKKVVFMHGFDKEGHPVCYNIYGEFQNKELYKKAFSDGEGMLNFLRWRIQFLERSIRKLDFTPSGVSTIVQISDLKNSPGPGKRELRQATQQALQMLQDNYPEFVAKHIFINVPWWYLAFNRMISPFLSQRTKSRFVFAGPSKSVETLLSYIAPEQLPVKYGGLSNDGEFDNTDAVTEIIVKPAAKHTVEFPVNEKCLLSWELRVIRWDVSYGAEFVPSAEGSYAVIIQKARKVASSEESVVCYSFEIGEPGKVVLTIDNPSSKKKKLLYRWKTSLLLKHEI